MSSLQILTIGTNSNLIFYAWKLFESRSAEVTVVNKSVKDERFTFTPTASPNVKHSFQPHHLCSLILQIPSGSVTFDIAIISCSSLQLIQSTVAEIAPYLNSESLIVIESSTYVNLEPFVSLSLPKGLKSSVVAIMNECDIRKLTSQDYSYSTKSIQETRIFVGSSVGDSKIAKVANYQRFARLLLGMKVDASSMTILKSLNPKEFMTYQWKLALPLIVFHSLSILFESDLPSKLVSQILCKPLISGIINEVFKIIKKMECKLVKGYETEANLTQIEMSLYKSQTNPRFPEYFHSNRMFYNYYHKNDLDIDLLLLQPILLADDNGIRTPYLENLYSIICQFLKFNDKSLFFTRNTTGSKDQSRESQAKELQAKELQVKDLQLKMSQLNIVEGDLQKKNSELRKAELAIQQSAAHNSKVNQDIQGSQAKFEDILLQINDAERKLGQLNSNIGKKSDEYSNVLHQTEKSQSELRELEKAKQDTRKQVEKRHSSGKSSTGGFEDFTSTVVMGETISADTPQVKQNAYAPRLQKSVSPERSQQFYDAPTVNGANGSNGSTGVNGSNGAVNYPQQNSQNHASFSNGYVQNNYAPNGHLQNGYAQNGYQGQGYQQNGYNGHAQNGQNPQYGNLNGVAQRNASYSEQQPPHGLPSTGLPAGQFPPNLRTGGSDSLVSNGNRYQQQQQQQQQQQFQYQQQQQPQPQSRRVPSLLSAAPSSYYEPSHHQQATPPFNNLPSFNNAAPIDPALEQRFKTNPKRQNRRSAYPTMNGNLDGLDMGGRGGMPMSGAHPQKHRSVGNSPNGLAQFNNTTSPPLQQRRTMSNNNLLSAQIAPSLQPPVAANVSSSSSASTNDTPKTGGEEESHYQAGPPVGGAKPLGGVLSESTSSSKKKRGLFGKKK